MCYMLQHSVGLLCEFMWFDNFVAELMLFLDTPIS